MALIRKPHELQVQPSIKALIYGQPGIGKSTISLSAPNPLLLDFDGGVHRVNPAHHVDTVQIGSWQDMLDVLKEDLSGYKTLVIDTAGKMLDYMSLYLIQKNPKLGKANGALSLQGYGERKAEFNNFLKQVSLMGKHLVFVAHDKEEKKGDETIIRPEIGGSSGGDLIKELDLVGYMEAIGKKRTISFNPCEKYYAKNTCNLPEIIEVPAIIDQNGVMVAQNNMLSGIFHSYQSNLESRKEMAAKYSELMDVLDSKVEAITDALTANDAAEWAASFDGHIWDSKRLAAIRINEKAKQIGLKLDAKTKKYGAA